LLQLIALLMQNIKLFLLFQIISICKGVVIIEEPGEQCTVVFALTVKEPLANVCACVYVEWGGGGCYTPPSPSIYRFRNN
jgi:hypothetical protein